MYFSEFNTDTESQHLQVPGNRHLCVFAHTSREAAQVNNHSPSCFWEQPTAGTTLFQKESKLRVFQSLPCPCIGTERGGVRRKSQQDTEAEGALLFPLILLCHLQYIFSCAGYGLWLRAKNRQTSE